MISQLLFKSTCRFFKTHPLQLILTICGVALGVAVVIAIDLAGSSAEYAFRSTADIFTGKVTHQINHTSNKINEKLYASIKMKFPELDISPVIERNIKLNKYPTKNFRLFGIDPLSESGFRDFNTGKSDGNWIFSLLSQPHSVFISESTAKNHNIKIGDKLAIGLNGGVRYIHIAGLIKTQTKTLETALNNLIICDISLAQEVLNSIGFLTRIDINSSNPHTINKLSEYLPTEFQLTPISNAGNVLSQMTEAFRTNLQAMSLLALIVGMFLVYNTISFSLIQRQQHFSVLRTLGVTHKEIFFIVLLETLLIGFLGTLIGMLLGVILGKGLLILVVRTINDLYFDLNLSELIITPISFAKGLFLGMIATLISAWLPLKEALKTTPQQSHLRSLTEKKSKLMAVNIARYGLYVLLSGLVVVFVFKGNLLLSFIFLFFIFCGYAMIIPYLVMKIIQLLRPTASKYLGNIGVMSLGNISNSLSRTGMAIMALTLAVATTVGVSTMVTSFRGAVADWLEQSLIEDIYLSIKQNTGLSRENIATQLLPILKSDPNITHISTRFWTKVNSPLGNKPAYIQDLPEQGFEKFIFLADDSLANYSSFENTNSILISEPLANKNELNAGEKLALFTDKGTIQFRIIGIYRDYTTDQGLIAMSRKTYAKYWLNPEVSSFGLSINEPTNSTEVIDQLKNRISVIDENINAAIDIRSNHSIREKSLEIFNQTFAITNVLRLLTIIVAFIGILSAFMALQIERKREFATLRVIGLTPRQMVFSLLFETSFMGLIAGILALPLGLILSAILIFIINIQSFGWSMAISPSSVELSFAVLTSIAAAFLAGLYPAYKMLQSEPALSLRND